MLKEKKRSSDVKKFYFRPTLLEDSIHHCHPSWHTHRPELTFMTSDQRLRPRLHDSCFRTKRKSFIAFQPPIYTKTSFYVNLKRKLPKTGLQSGLFLKRNTIVIMLMGTAEFSVTLTWPFLVPCVHQMVITTTASCYSYGLVCLCC